MAVIFGFGGDPSESHLFGGLARLFLSQSRDSVKFLCSVSCRTEIEEGVVHEEKDRKRASFGGGADLKRGTRWARGFGIRVCAAKSIEDVVSQWRDAFVLLTGI